MTTTALARPVRLDLETFSRAVAMHPELVRRLVALGLLDAYVDAAGELWFPPTQLSAAARVQRLRAGFGMNYASLALVTELLDRIARLERALRARSPNGAMAATNVTTNWREGGRSWTRNV